MTRDEFLEYINRNSVKGPKNIEYVEESPLSLPFDEVKFIGQGIFSTVYKVRTGKEYWTIKEGVYDLKFPLFRNIYVPLPRRFFNSVYSLFGSNIMPSHRAAIDQLQEYILLARYFGFFESNEENSISGFDPKVLEIQRNIRENLKQSILEEDSFAEIILTSVKTFKNYHKIKEIINDDEILQYHFLPQEYLILSLTNEKKRLLSVFHRKIENYYIIQEWVEGETLGKIKHSDLIKNKKVLKRLIMFLLLAISMAYYESKIIDSRPEGILSGFNDWFSNTGNIIIQPKEGNIKFIDTRWLHHKEGNIIQKGIVVSDLIMEAMGKNLKRLVEEVS